MPGYNRATMDKIAVGYRGRRQPWQDKHDGKAAHAENLARRAARKRTAPLTPAEWESAAPILADLERTADTEKRRMRARFALISGRDGLRYMGGENAWVRSLITGGT